MKLISSTTFSSTVCSRRAPMFSTAPFTATAASASASMASSVKVSVTPSVAISAWFWRIRLASGSVRMRRKSSRVSAFSSTRIGRRPCSSGSRSEGLATWKAPEAMNSTWSVFTGPYLVETVVPSISGKQVALHALAGDVGAGALGARGDLVDLVDEDDAAGLGQGQRLLRSAPPGRAACRSPRRSAAPRRRRRWSCASWCAGRRPWTSCPTG